MIFQRQHIIRIQSVDSSNDEAWRRIKNGQGLDGQIIQTAFQTAGKGQSGAFWESESGKNLLFSCIWKPDYVSPSDQFMLTKTISLAIRESISRLLPHKNVQIKWPNDIYAENGKIAGILIENAITGNKIEYCTAGIGININQTEFRSDAPNPVSCKQITGKTFELDECLEVVRNSINSWLLMLKNNHSQAIDASYLKYLLGYNQILSFQHSSRQFEARICGVNRYGRIMLDEDGTIRHYDMKELVFLF